MHLVIHPRPLRRGAPVGEDPPPLRRQRPDGPAAAGIQRLSPSGAARARGPARRRVPGPRAAVQHEQGSRPRWSRSACHRVGAITGRGSDPTGRAATGWCPGRSGSPGAGTTAGSPPSRPAGGGRGGAAGPRCSARSRGRTMTAPGSAAGACRATACQWAGASGVQVPRGRGPASQAWASTPTGSTQAARGRTRRRPSTLSRTRKRLAMAIQRSGWCIRSKPGAHRHRG